ncbi:hypothetical protein GW17_00026657 [Ensete ventricosum]|nr:hypothetical protein GW17_00026657 [Ensete ventricosum]
MRTARYRVVLPKLTIGGRLREKSNVGGRLREKKGRKKKKRRRRKKKRIHNSFPCAVLDHRRRHPRLRAFLARR